MRPFRSKAEDSWIKGLETAALRGATAAAKPDKTLANNPYKRLEHRKSWEVAFKKARGE